MPSPDGRLPERESLLQRLEELVAACSDSDSLRAAAMRLAADEKQADEVRSWLLSVGVEARASELPADVHPARIGPYRVLEVLGEGGMGTVYLAEQVEPVRRQVAVKLIKLGMDTRAVVARFEHERQALALMQHDGIARVYDCGSTERGQPYFVMEMVAGSPLNRHCEQHRLSVRERIGLLQQVCAAVTHAHQKGVVHRDLKPGNILVQNVDARPQVKVIDFGLSKALGDKLVEASLFTEAGRIVGTPEYMAPEQAQARHAEIDTRADIYSLGVILYELLVGSLPFASADLRRGGLVGLPAMVQELDPPRPSARLLADEQANEIAAARQMTPRALQRKLRTDLDWITLKAMAKDPGRRYESAAALAQDLQRHLDDQPIEAGPPSVWSRASKYWRRHRVALSAAAAILLAVGAGATLLVHQRLVNAAEQRLVAERGMAEQMIQTGTAVSALGQRQEAPLFFAEALRRDPESWPARVRCATWMREVLENDLTRISSRPVQDVEVIGEGQRVLVQVGGDEAVLVAVRPGPGSAVALAGVSACAAAGSSERVLLGRSDGRLCLFDVSQSEPVELHSWQLGGRVTFVAAGSDGSSAVAGNGDSLVRVELAAPFASTTWQSPVPIVDAAVDAAAKTIAVVGSDRRVRVLVLADKALDTIASELTHVLPRRGAQRSRPCVARDGGTIATVAAGNAVGVWRRDGSVRTIHHDGITSLAIDPQARWLAIGGTGVRIVDLRANDAPREMERTSRANDVMFLADGSFLVASLEGERLLRMYPTSGSSTAIQSGSKEATLTAPGAMLAAPEHGAWFFSLENLERLRRWRAPLPDRTRARWGRLPTDQRTLYLCRGDLSPDGAFYANVLPDLTWGLLDQAARQVVRIVDVATGHEVGLPLQTAGTPVRCRFSPRGEHVIVASAVAAPFQGGRVEVWSWRQGRRALPAIETPTGVLDVGVSPDGQRLVVLLEQGEVWLFDATTGRRLAAHQHGPPSQRWQAQDRIVFSPRGNRFVTLGVNDQARLWDTMSGQPLGAGMQHRTWCFFATFAPDGRHLITGEWAAGDYRSEALVWRVDGDAPVRAWSLPHPDGVFHGALSADGEQLVTSCRDGRTRVWRWAEQPSVPATVIHHRGAEAMCAFFHPLRRDVVLTLAGISAGDADTLGVWHLPSGLPLMPPARVGSGLGASNRWLHVGNGGDHVVVWGQGHEVSLHDTTLPLAPRELDGEQIVAQMKSRLALGLRSGQVDNLRAEEWLEAIQSCQQPAFVAASMDDRDILKEWHAANVGRYRAGQWRDVTFHAGFLAGLAEEASVQLLAAYARVADKENQAELLVPALRTIVANHPDCWQAHHALAVFARGDPQVCIEHLRAARATGVSLYEIDHEYAMLLYRVGDREGFRQAAYELCLRHADIADVKRMASIARLAVHYPKVPITVRETALRLARRVAELYPEDAWYCDTRTLAFVRAGYYSEALASSMQFNWIVLRDFVRRVVSAR